MSGTSSLRFDRFLVDAAGRRVLRDGADVHLTPKAFELLLLLIGRRPAAVSKSDIMESLWPGTFVLEANVANLVAEIRSALRDDPSQPRVVRTVPRFGYAFAGEVAAAAPDGSPVAAAHAGPGDNGFSAAGQGAPGAATAAAAATPFALIGAHGRLPLTEGSTVLGREGIAADLLNSPLVSRRHARIDVAGASVSLEDLGSKNGCSVDGQRISSRVEIAPGTRIGIGPLVVTLIREDEESTKTFHGTVLSGL